MGLLGSIKDVLFGLNPEDEKFYEVVAQEIIAGNIRSGLWVKALAEANFSEDKAKVRYIKYRIETLKAEFQDEKKVHEDAREFRQRLLADEKHRKESNALPAYQRGEYPEAFQGFESLAEKGEAWAQNFLAWMLEHGQGVAINLPLALHWYQRAAEQNNKDAQFHMGRICLEHRKDYEASHKWFSLAEKNGHPEANQMKKRANEFVQAQKNLHKR